MTTNTTISIPRLDNESSRAYAARVEYITLGAQRSQDAVSQKLGKSKVQMHRWSVAYDWVDHARRYDETLANLAVQEHAEAYKRDLEAHRLDAMKYGKLLCGVAIEMITSLRIQQRTIEYTPAALATISRALTTGMDLQAHALRIADLLPKLSNDESD